MGIVASLLLGVGGWFVVPFQPGLEASPSASTAPIAAPAQLVAPSASPAVATPRPPSPQVEQLRTELSRIVSSAVGSRGGIASVLVASLDRGDTLFSLNPDLPVAPASNMKLFTTAAALYYLGPEFRFSTYVLGDGEIREGVLHGDVVLYGTGDPAMSSRMLGRALLPLQALADSLRARGITEVRGDVVGDGSYFDDRWIAEGWKEEYRLDSYSAPVGALSLAENIVSVRVQPGTSAGLPARITTTPGTEGMLIQNRVRTVASGNASVRFSYDPDGLVLEGQLPRNHSGIARTVTVVDPANFAAASFRKVLESAGISVTGGVRTIRASSMSPVGRGAREAEDPTRPPPRILGTHLSPTLEEVATVTNHVSHNLFAEAMFKTVGRIALGEGTFEAGSRAIQYFLECEKPFDFASIQIVDGSGLSPLNRVTSRLTIHLLDLMRRTDVWETFHASLPEAASPNGGSHSLRNRMGGTSAARNLRAKTGTIAGVSSLSGYVEAANGEMLAFSIYANDLRSSSQTKRMEDAIGAELARFTRPAEQIQVIAAEGSEAAGDAQPSPDSSDEANASPASAGLATPIAEPEPARTHKVASGETLDGIARRYGVTVAELEAANPRIQPRRLQIGQTLTLPSR